ncbi:hypothetical protein [Sphingobium phenoxybenzoativorans]|uniref:hypothetical protein n=1 Tax=Sphingobium phenoxybenzoativorans TaxID=1592790 RepID=UPI001FEBABB8|nr:hypothetical protein [Sphingobium phenoxybenzoativorans]
MSAWHDPDRTVVDAFLVKSQFRPGSVPTYRWFLAPSRCCPPASGGGPADARRLAEGDAKTLAIVDAAQSGLHCRPLLDHLVEIGLIADNPVAALRRRYNVKQSKPIWRALASPNPDESLAALRRPAPFGSVLGDFMQDHVMLMRSRDINMKRRLTGCCGSIGSFRPVPTSRSNHLRQ